MSRCHTCRHWKADTHVTLPPEHRTGVCKRIQGPLMITLVTGWDGGYVDYIETWGTFGCVLHEEGSK